MGSTSFILTGDSLITECLPNEKRVEDLEIKEIFDKADVRITNLETVISSKPMDLFASKDSGGSWIQSDINVLESLNFYGFNMLSCANNHALDFSYEGLLQTIKAINKYKFKFSGIGPNASTAREPAYFNTKSTKISLISCTASLYESWVAGDSNEYYKGRPGVNPLRIQRTHIIPKHLEKELQILFEKLDYDKKERSKKNGDFIYIGNNRYFLGDGYSTVKSILSEDKKRVLEDVRIASYYSDYLVVSIHYHDLDNNEQVPEYLREFARKLIDAGASIIMCHGPHKVLGIEIYNSCPIFYSLGNFIFHIDQLNPQPNDFDKKFYIPDSNKTQQAKLLYRNSNGKSGLSENKEYWLSYFPMVTFNDKKLESITIYPIDLNFKKSFSTRGWPKLASNNIFLKDILKNSIISDEVKVHFDIKSLTLSF